MDPLLLRLHDLADEDAARLCSEMPDDCVNEPDSMGFTPLSRAAHRGKLRTMEVLARRGADAHLAAALCNAAGAARDGALEMMLFLYPQLEVNVAEPRSGLTPLHIVARDGVLADVQLLLGRGASVTAVDSDGCTPLSYASRFDHAAIARLLREAVRSRLRHAIVLGLPTAVVLCCGAVPLRRRAGPSPSLALL